MHRSLLTVGVCLVLGGAGCASDGAAVGRSAQPSSVEVVSADDIAWGDLNPARGDASPRAGGLWGDRTSGGASGFLVRFAPEFSSPPHIHNVTYRGVVIDGRVHNDDPGAARLWMGAGSYWTQPAGEAHITAADDRASVAYIEIDEGPYLVHPAAEAFDRGERPINVDRSNVMWVDASMTPWIEMDDRGAQARVAYLWGDASGAGVRGMLLELPRGFSGEIRSGGPEIRAVVIEGALTHADGATGTPLAPGSYFGSEGVASHWIASSDSEGCTLYVRSDGAIELVAARAGK